MSSTQNKVKLSELIRPEQVWIAPEVFSKTEVVEHLVQLVCKENASLDVQEVLPQILQREESMSTTLDTGLSIPHARLEEVENISAALAICPQGMQDPSKPEISVHAMLLFLSPAQPAFFQRHLQFLAAVAETFQPELMKELLSCATVQEIIEKLEIK